jgi:aspartate ammonia-lyase
VQQVLAEKPALYGKLALAAAQVISSRLRNANARLTGRAAGYLSGELRMEHDLLGERPLSADLYYGIQTLRATENFPITGIPISQYPHLIEALAAVKEAAAMANAELGLLDARVADAIVGACREIRAGPAARAVRVDVIQGGAGTSTNMNANEVIANRALELLGSPQGRVRAAAPQQPREPVAVHQRRLPTRSRSPRTRSVDATRPRCTRCARPSRQGQGVRDVLKMGRTQLQDAVPMTLGQEFNAFGVTMLEEVDRLREAGR